MVSRFQAATLVASPSYPNSIAWSEENLIAVASGHLVTILNAAMPLGPRGLISVHKSEPYPIGVIKGDELLSGSLLRTCLRRAPLTRVLSISWSPIGMAVNSGCLLALCTSEGRVKLYRPPFSDFCAEWIEVFDITDRLFEYLASISFGEPSSHSTELFDEPERYHSCGCGDDPPYSISEKIQKRRMVKAFGPLSGCTAAEASSNQLSYPRTAKYASVDPSPSFGMEEQDLAEVLNAKSDNLIEYIPQKAALPYNSKRKYSNKTPADCTLPLISTNQYASRSEMLASVVVAWSPMLKLSSNICQISENNSSKWLSLLAVGSQSGRISFWKIHAPHSYSIEQNGVSLDVAFFGLLQAHSSWISTISWAFLSSDSSNPKVLLATGSSDGRTWLRHGEEFLKASEVSDAPFIMLQEILHVNAAPVSVVSLTVPSRSQTILLAVGKGSGALEVWRDDNDTTKFDKVASCDAHDQVITGLAWAFEGHCLYSCSQDNFVRSWMLSGSSISEVPIPPSPGLRSFNDLPDAFISCLGLAVSPGNIAVTMVHNFDVEKLNQMYEARIQKAAVEFFWIGGQQWKSSPVASLDFTAEALPGFSNKDASYWLTNILWSLRRFEHVDKPLVVWDILAALSVFKQTSPEFVDYILVKWLSVSYLGSDMALPLEKLVTRVSKIFSVVSSRKLHLLNLICRRVMLSDLKAAEINKNLQNLGGLDGAKDSDLGLWMELLSDSETELRQRLVGFTFSAFLTSTNLDSRNSHPGYWYPSGLAQMEQWVEQTSLHVSDQVKLLSSEVKTCKRSGTYEHEAEEQCSFCSALVPFETSEFALCKGSKRGIGGEQRHELPRCAVSMQVCPATPLWLCKCCCRSTFNLPPETLFTITRFPLDYKSLPKYFRQKEISKALCSFCGILLQRSQPDFLLSPLPV